MESLLKRMRGSEIATGYEQTTLAMTEEGGL